MHSPGVSETSLVGFSFIFLYFSAFNFFLLFLLTSYFFPYTFHRGASPQGNSMNCIYVCRFKKVFLSTIGQRNTRGKFNLTLQGAMLTLCIFSIFRTVMIVILVLCTSTMKQRRRQFNEAEVVTSLYLPFFLSQLALAQHNQHNLKNGLCILKLQVFQKYGV